MKNKQHFASRLGALMVIAGAAVGLGNIWKFPYMLGNNGGAAFLLVYLGFVVFLGIPLLLTELTIGRASQKNAIDAFGTSPFRFFGILGMLTITLILTFYSTIGGWVLAYTYYYAVGALHHLSTEEIQAFFGAFIAHPYKPIFWQFLFMLCTAVLLLGGVQKGLEKGAKIMMPAIFVGLLILAVRALTLEGGLEGLAFMFTPDFSKIDTAVIGSALGQAFFSLSLGSATVITYGAYVKKEQNLLKLSLQVAFSDVMIALLAGIVIFPAVFAFGLKVDAGPPLIFITLPNIFKALPLGLFFGLLFFICVAFAALTSSIAMLEAPVAYLTTHHKYSRKASILMLSVLIFAVGILMTLSHGMLSDYHLFNKTIFELCADVVDRVAIPLASMGYTLYALWQMKRAVFVTEIFGEKLNQTPTFAIQSLVFLLRYIAPMLVGIILFQGIQLLFF